MSPKSSTSGPILSSGLVLQGLLGSTPRGSTHLARKGGSRRDLRVVRLLPGSAAGEAWENLRPDFCDLACLAHPSLALPSSFSWEPSLRLTCVVRPHIRGSELGASLQGRAPQEALPWLLSAAEALSILHRFGFAHRNIKVSNFLVPSSEAGDFRVVLTDPAWWPEDDSGAPRTRGGEGGRAHSGIGEDLRDLGEVFRTVLAGWHRSIPGEPAAPGLPLDLERIVQKLLSNDAARSYASIEPLLEDLRLLGRRRPSLRPPPEAFLGRRAEVARAAEALEPHHGGAVMAVTGEAGMGRTAFLRRVAREAEAMAYRTVLASCFPESGEPGGTARTLVEALIPPGARGRAIRDRCRKLFEGSRTSVDSQNTPTRSLVRGMLDLLQDAAGKTHTLLLVDDAHLADPLTLEVLAALAVCEGGASRPSPRTLSLAAGFRAEAPFQSVLRPLLDALAASRSAVTIELGRLAPEAARAWIEAALADHPEVRDRIRDVGDLGGHPLAIQNAIRNGGSPPPPSVETAAALADLHAAYLRSLGHAERSLLEVLAVLGRPATQELIGAVLGAPWGTRRARESLMRQGTLVEFQERDFFRHGSFQSWLLNSLSSTRRIALHGRIARVLDASTEVSPAEAARHWLASSSPRKGIESALLAARAPGLSSVPREAVALYRAALDLLPSRDRRRRAIVSEMADSLARAGDFRAAADALEMLLDGARTRLERAELHGRAGVARHRAGDVVEARRHLAAGLELLDPAGDRALPQRLRIVSELAEISVNAGEYEGAEKYCLDGLEAISRLDGGAIGPDIRRQEMVLLGTLAHAELRRFRLDEARSLFERSLRAGDSLGPGIEKAFILNNLGTLHVQAHRYRDAIECYQKAVKVSRRLGDEPGLAVLESNLATLYARTGAFAEAEMALDRAARHEARSESSKIRSVRLHNAGLTKLALGRYASAIEDLEAAISLGQELADRHMSAFDHVHLAECRLYRGELQAAKRALDAAGMDAAPAPVPSMVAARRALLAAFRRKPRDFRASEKDFAASPAHGIAYVDAWNGIFLGWARRLFGNHRGAGEILERSRTFFAVTGAAGGEIHAAMELAQVEGDRGDWEEAVRRLRRIRESHPMNSGPLRNPMLSARLLLYEARALLDAAPPRSEEASALLAEAESRLIGQRLRDVESLVRESKRRLRKRNAAGHSPPLGAMDGPIIEGRQIRESMEGRSLAPIGASELHGHSSAIRRVQELVRQLAPASQPVLISGETGTGKDLVARAIHGESRRRERPFTSLACGALPEELLEAELFGYRRGAFTGAESDHEGLLVSARGGSVLFDEVGDMSLGFQAKLLRVLDRNLVRALGETTEVEIDVRFLFSTNRDLRALAHEGGFRRDFLFRLGAFEVSVPPLRERIEDIPILAERFATEALGPGSRAGFSDGALRALASHVWPGNVRELRNVVFRLVLGREGTVSREDVEKTLGHDPPRGLFPPELLRQRRIEDLVAQLEREHLVQLHADHGGDLEAMARVLGITVRALYGRFGRLGLRPGDL